MVGKTEQDLKKDGVQYKVGRFPFLANRGPRQIWTLKASQVSS